MEKTGQNLKNSVRINVTLSGRLASDWLQFREDSSSDSNIDVLRNLLNETNNIKKLKIYEDYFLKAAASGAITLGTQTQQPQTQQDDKPTKAPKEPMLDTSRYYLCIMPKRIYHYDENDPKAVTEFKEYILQHAGDTGLKFAYRQDPHACYAIRLANWYEDVAKGDTEATRPVRGEGPGTVFDASFRREPAEL